MKTAINSNFQAIEQDFWTFILKNAPIPNKNPKKKGRDFRIHSIVMAVGKKRSQFPRFEKWENLLHLKKRDKKNSKFS